MKLISRAAVYWRVYLLLKNSENFTDELRNVRTDNPSQKIVQEICDKFMLAFSDDEMKIAQDLIMFLLTDCKWLSYCDAHGMMEENIKVSVYYDKDDTVTIKINAPLESREFKPLWNQVKQIQHLFIHHEKYVKNLLSVGREKISYSKLIDEMKNLKSLMDDKKPASEEQALIYFGKHEHSWEFPQIPSLDDDLEIYSIRKKYTRFRDAEDRYQKMMLEKFLLDFKGKKVHISDAILFAEALQEHCPEFKNLTTKQIEKRLKFKNYKTRIEEMEEHWSI